MEKNKINIGLLGGTFDPIHYGHLILAEECRKKFNLQKIIFITSAIHPHKKRKVTPAKHRYNMVRLAIKGNKNFGISDIELKREGVSFTCDTIQYFNEKYFADVIYFILGIDSLLKIGTWKKGRKILEFCKFIVATRPGYNIENIPFFIREKIKTIKIAKIDISSSQIRKRLHRGESIKYLLPAAVEKYIYKNKLYKPKLCNCIICPTCRLTSPACPHPPEAD